MLSAHSLLAVFAHPDDETYRAGGVLAIMAERGASVTVLTATRGQAGSCGKPPICSREELPLVREIELKRACDALGVEPPIIWDYDDGKLSGIEEDLPVRRIVELIFSLQPDVVLTWPPDGLSGHPDHIAVSRWATKAFDHSRRLGLNRPGSLYYLAIPVSLAREFKNLPLHPVPDNEISLTIDVGPAWEKKMKAIRYHQTQLGESPILTQSDEMQKLFLGREYFVLARKPDSC